MASLLDRDQEYARLGWFHDVGLLILRLGAGGMLLFGHGWGKFSGFGEMAGQFPDPLGVGSPVSLGLTVFAEFVCAGLVCAGLFTRFAAIPPVIMLLVAGFVIHADDPWGKKEFALIYLVPFLALVFTGGGRYALDALRRRNG